MIFQVQKGVTGHSGPGSKLRRVIIQISVDGVNVLDAKTRSVLFKHPIHHVSFCADDKQVSKNLQLKLTTVFCRTSVSFLTLQKAKMGNMNVLSFSVTSLQRKSRLPSEKHLIWHMRFIHSIQ